MISNEEEMKAELKRKRAFRRHAVTGQVPEVVEAYDVAGEKDGDEVVIIEDDDDAHAEVSQRGNLLNSSVIFEIAL